MLSSGPLSAERATRNGVCAVAHTKSAGILRLRSGVLLSEAHRRASVEARSRRTPALDLPAEAPFDCARLARPVEAHVGRRAPLRMLPQTMVGLVSEQRAPSGLGRDERWGRAKDPRDVNPGMGGSAYACCHRYPTLPRNVTGVLRAARYSRLCISSVGRTQDDKREKIASALARWTL